MSKEAEFGELIRRLRTERGLSLRKAATKIGVTHMRLDELERGSSRSTERPTRARRELVCQIADAYGISRDTLLELAGYAKESPDLGADEQLLIDMVRRLDEHHRALAIQLVATVDRLAQSKES